MASSEKEADHASDHASDFDGIDLMTGDVDEPAAGPGIEAGPRSSRCGFGFSGFAI